MYLPALCFYISSSSSILQDLELPTATTYRVPITSTTHPPTATLYLHSGPSSRAALCCFPPSFHHENETQKEEEEEEIKRSSPILFFFPTSNDTAKHTSASKLHLLKRKSLETLVCGCVSAEKTQYGKKRKKREKETRTTQTKTSISRNCLSFSLFLSTATYTHAPRTNSSRLQRAEREHCIALHYKIKTIDPTRQAYSLFAHD